MLSQPQWLAEETANSQVAKGSTGMTMTETEKEGCELGALITWDLATVKWVVK